MRDYYRVEDNDGGRFWLFRDGPLNTAPIGTCTAFARDCVIALDETTMGTVTIRNLDDEVIERLEMRAKNHRRSLEAEIRDLLSHAAQQPMAIDALSEADRIAALTPKGVKQTDSVILLQEDRRR